MQYLIFIILSPISGIIPLIAGFTVAKNGSKPEVRYLLILMLFIFGWLLFNNLELLSRSEEATYIWALVSYPFIMSTGPLWLLFALHFTRVKFPRFIAPLLFAAPLFFSVSAMTNHLHHLLWANVTYIKGSFYTAMLVSHGPVYWLSVGLYYPMVVIGALLIIRQYLGAHRIYRYRIIWLILGSMTPFLLQMLYLSRLLPGFTKDFTPIAFSIATLSVALGMLRFRILDLRPVARQFLVGHMEDGVIVLDHMKRIVDINPSGEKILGEKSEDLIGKSCSILDKNIFNPEKQAEFGWLEITKEVAGRECIFELTLTPIPSDSFGQNGFLLILRDITWRIRLEEERNSVIKKLQEALAEVKTLSGLLPVCANCKNVRDDDGYWQKVEVYIRSHSEAEVSHSLCPDCAKELYPGLLDNEKL